jgi:hypothetical protein
MESAPTSHAHIVRDIVLNGVCSGMLIAILNASQYQFLPPPERMIFGSIVQNHPKV